MRNNRESEEKCTYLVSASKSLVKVKYRARARDVARFLHITNATYVLRLDPHARNYTSTNFGIIIEESNRLVLPTRARMPTNGPEMIEQLICITSRQKTSLSKTTALLLDTRITREIFSGKSRRFVSSFDLRCESSSSTPIKSKQSIFTNRSLSTSPITVPSTT